jgi:F420-dependent oxidoreductase-like protein
MRLGLLLGFWGPEGPPPGLIDAVVEAERLGYESVWTSEAFGSDALTPLAWIGSHTGTMRLGTGIMHLAARTPAAAAMAALTLDHLCGGRFVLGLGVSGPDLVEGWHGQPFFPPLGRTREYVDVVRRVLARSEPVTSEGRHFPLPLRQGSGLGRPFLSMVQPLRADLPIVLAAEGPRNVALAAEIADGWLATFYSPSHDAHLRAALAEGFGRPGARRSAEEFEILGTVPVVLREDVDGAMDSLRRLFTRFVGPMGARGRNFHFEAWVRMGYEEVAVRVRDLWLAGRPEDAAAAIPASVIDELALVGPAPRIRERLADWRRSLVTTLLVHVPLDLRTLREVAELVLG